MEYTTTCGCGTRKAVYCDTYRGKDIIRANDKDRTKDIENGTCHFCRQKVKVQSKKAAAHG